MAYMWAPFGKLFSNVKSYYNEINSATLTGAIDILVMEQPDGTYQSSPFHVRFGKIGVMRAREKVVYIEINGEPIHDFHMKLGDAGEAFFVQEVLDQWEGPEHLATSPISCSPSYSAEVLKHSQSDTVLQNTTSIKSAADLAAVQLRTRTETENSSRSSSSSELSKKENGLVFKPISQSDDELLESGGMFDIEVSDDESKLPIPEVVSGMSKTVSLPIIQESSQSRTEYWTNNPYHSAQQFHPFSDTDITPVMRSECETEARAVISPAGSRPHTPKSDTEFELPRKASAAVAESEDIHWSWGELPESSPPTPSHKPETETPAVNSNPKDDQSGGLLSFMRSTKKLRHKPEEGGIYLDDLNLEQMEPEVAALYFPNKKYEVNSAQTTVAQSLSCEDEGQPEEDVESGNGESLPHSPDLTNTSRVLASPTSDTGTIRDHDCGLYGDIAMSTCGHLLENGSDMSADLFQQSLVTYDDFCRAPQLLQNPDLVVRISGKYYNWVTSAPIIMSMVCFQNALPQAVQADLVKLHMMSVKKENKSRRGYWWPFGAKETPRDVESGGNSAVTSSESTPNGSPKKDQLAKGSVEHKHKPWRRSKPIIIINSEEDNSDTEREKTTPRDIPNTGQSLNPINSCPSDRYKKTLRLTSDQLHQLNLHEGANDIEFSVTTQLQGTTRCKAQIFLWKHTDKIVVSDIDGTITRSDVLGHLLPMVGKDWSHIGVADLYTKITANGYKTIYLSSRAIGQAQMTRDFLDSVKQGDISLPPGPLFLSPSSLISAFHKEVIEKKPEEFKIRCLKDIQSLFSKPLYAGFGNRINDMYAYRAVGIPNERIFLINSSGQVKSEYSRTFQSTYANLSDVVDHYFPPLKEIEHFSEPAKFSNFTFWREPLPDITINLSEI